MISDDLASPLLRCVAVVKRSKDGCVGCCFFFITATHRHSLSLCYVTHTSLWSEAGGQRYVCGGGAGWQGRSGPALEPTARAALSLRRAFSRLLARQAAQHELCIPNPPHCHPMILFSSPATLPHSSRDRSFLLLSKVVLDGGYTAAPACALP